MRLTGSVGRIQVVEPCLVSQLRKFHDVGERLNVIVWVMLYRSHQTESELEAMIVIAFVFCFKVSREPSLLWRSASSDFRMLDPKSLGWLGH